MVSKEDRAFPAKEMKSSRVRLLTDEPASTDEFAAGAHARVAGAIVELVTAEPGGKVIGLEGLWGSGKSTVVGLVRELLDKSSTQAGGAGIKTVVFDAWAHQGDPLRRTFLEALIADLEKFGWLDKETATGVRTELAGRTSVMTTSSTSRLSFEGKLAAGATVLLALGAALFSNRFHTHHRLAIYLGAILLLAPLLVVAGLWFAKWVGIMLGGRKAGGGRRRLTMLKPSSFFASDHSTETVTEGVQRGEPTSVEFEQIFSDVLNASLTDQRRLLLVLDNLDRVDESDARTVLATMQTFTGSGTPTRLWSPRVWTLIPYDPSGLQKLWDPRPTVNEDEALPPTATTSAFIEKVFQIRFEAPPLVLSDWRAYVMRLLERAFPGEDGDELRAVLRLRGLYPGVEPGGTVAGEAPTPRQLKQFVNQIGAIRRQRQDVSLVHIAYYTMLKRDAISIPSRLIEGAVPHTKLAHLLKNDVREDLAALHFGAAQDLAQQLLLRPALETAFATGDAGTITRLGERPGFVDALEALDIERRAEGGGIELTRAVAVLGASGALEVREVDEWARARLEPLAKRTTPWRVQGYESGVGLAHLLNRITPADDGALNDLLARIVATPLEADTEGHGQLEGVAGLVDELSTLGRSSESLRVVVDIPEARLVDSLAYVREQSRRPKALQSLELTFAPAEVAAAMVEAVASNRTAEVEPVLAMLLQRPERISLESLAAASIDWLRSNEPVSQQQLAVFLGWLDRARKAATPESVLLAAADEGTLMHLVAVARANGWHDEAAGAAMLHLRVQPELPEPQAVRQSAVGAAAVRQVLSNPDTDPEMSESQLRWLKQHKREAFELVAKISKGQAQSWVDRQMKGLSAEGDLLTSPSQYATNWNYLRGVLGDDLFVRHTRLVLDSDAGRAKVFDEPADPTLALNCLAACELEPEADYVHEVVTWAAGTVQSAPAVDWGAALQVTETQPLLALAVRLSGTKGAPTNPSGLQNALHSHFQALAAGEEAWRPDAETFAKLTRLLNPGARRVLASQLCAELEGRDGQVGPDLFPTYGQFLAGEPGFRTHSKLPNVIERFVAHDQWDVIRWFAELASEHGDTLDPANRQVEMQHLRDAVTAKLASADDDARPEVLSDLAGLLEA